MGRGMACILAMDGRVGGGAEHLMRTADVTLSMAILEGGERREGRRSWHAPAGGMPGREVVNTSSFDTRSAQGTGWDTARRLESDSPTS